jgi:hypothetical protein
MSCDFEKWIDETHDKTTTICFLDLILRGLLMHGFSFSALLVATAMGATAAHAQSMPRYNVESYCQEVSDFSGGSSMIYNGCIDQEQTAYNMLKARWSGFSAQMRGYCDEVASFGGGSYMLLDGCIQMESDAASGTKSFKY